MGKKNKDKFKGKAFGTILDAHSKKIRVQGANWDSPKTIAECVEETLAGITACPSDSLIPIGVTETAENALSLPYLAISSQYTQHVYSMYESGMKSQSKQTIIIPLCSDAAEGLKHNKTFMDAYETMASCTNIELVFSEIPKKVWKKLAAWADEDGGARMFVIRIPNLLMFHESVKKDEVAKPIVFDLIITVSNVTEKSLKKAKKNSVTSISGARKEPDQFDMFIDDFVRDTLSVIDNYGASAAHFPLMDNFYHDAFDAAIHWAARLTETSKSRTALKRLVFSTKEPKFLIEFNNNMTSLINKDEGCGMRVI